jgi:transposase
MGQATRTTKLLLDLGKRRQGGANTGKRAALDATVGLLNEARAFYIDFFLAHADKPCERIPYYSEKHLEMRERAEGKRRFVRLKVYDGRVWQWVNYPVVCSRYFEQRLSSEAWEHKSPILVLRPHSAEVHFPQTKAIAARKVRESKLDPDLVTVAVDLNVKNLAVITVRQHEHIIGTVFVGDAGLDQQRYRHLRRIAKKQWLSGKPVKGEHSNQQLWRHVQRMNADAAHKVARSIANVCAKYPGCVLLFERLRNIKASASACTGETSSGAHTVTMRCMLTGTAV